MDLSGETFRADNVSSGTLTPTVLYHQFSQK